MDKIEVTQADYDAAQAFFRDDRTGLAVKFQLGAEPQPLLEAFARHRLSHTPQSVEPVAWMPIESAPKKGNFLVWLSEPRLGSHVWPMRAGNASLIGERFAFDCEKPTHWTPALSAPDATNSHPPATHVAALVEAAKEAADIFDGMCDDEINEEFMPRLRSALAPFKGQDDE